MDVKLDSLIEKIRKEGIEEAQQTSEQILKDAKKKASSIVDQAKKDADKLVEDGKRQVEQFRTNAEADLKQATRNAELLLKEKITALFDNVFKRKVADAMTDEFLKELILNITSAWGKDTKAEIVLSEADQKKLESTLFGGLKEDLKKSISLRASSDLSKGFRIGLKDDHVFYDFSDDAIAQVLKTLINPRLKEILDK